jgi:hypothetical protein
LVKELQIKVKQLEVSEKGYRTQVKKLTELNYEADRRYYALEKSKQELIKMRDNDYEAMKNKNTKLRNELNTMQKYFNAKLKDIEQLENTNR